MKKDTETEKKVANTGRIILLRKYLDNKEVSLDPLYIDRFDFDPEKLPKLSATALTHCLTRTPVTILRPSKPVTILKPSKEVYYVIGNRYCYSHALLELMRGNSEVAINIQEVKDIKPEIICLNVLLDSLQLCPFMRIKPTLRVSYIISAFEEKERLKNFFNCRSKSAFLAEFSVPPADASRYGTLKAKERERLKTEKYNGRGATGPKAKKKKKIQMVESQTEPGQEPQIDQQHSSESWVLEWH